MHPKITLKPGREKSVRFHHPWIFSRAIQKIPTGIEDGSLVDVLSSNGEMLGCGYYNSHSQIAIRMLTFFKSATMDEKFFVEVFRAAFERRRIFLDDKTNVYRLIFSESDGLPGLIVDRYDEFLVIQIHTLGMEKLKDILVKALVEVFRPKGIYERSDVEVRKKEGLNTLPVGTLFGEEPPEAYKIHEYGLKMAVDLKKGQKTGFFIDQRENRNAIRAYCMDKNVLNLFSYSGGFSLSALAGGASKVTSVDISEQALKLAKENFRLNDFKPEDHEFITADVFAYLEDSIHKKRKFDLIIVDPPAFVKNQQNLDKALSAYIHLNAKALQVLQDGGIFVTSSCSSHVTPEMFRTVLFKAALKAGTDLTILESKTQPFDHPLKVNFPEGEYLKFFIGRSENY